MSNSFIRGVPKKRFSEIQHFDIKSERYQIYLLVMPKKKTTLVSGNDNKIAHPGGRKFLFFNQFN